MEHECKLCGYTWKGRTENKPKQCPKCKRYDYEKERAKP